MTVTAIEPRKKGLSALYIDGEFAMKIDTETLIANRIDVGCEIDDDTLHDVIEKADIKRAKDKAMWLISYRDHSKKELIDKISRTASVEAATAAAERMEQLGLINDENFAKRYALELINTKLMSPVGCVRKLIEKGIDRELAREVVDSIDVDISENIRSILNKKYKGCIFDEKGRRRAVSGLVRLGYSYSDINSVLREFDEDCDF